MIPPSACSKTTAISVVGVEAKPAFTTSTPHEIAVPQTSCSTISPERRASFPTTILYLSPACLGRRSFIFSQYAYVNFTMSIGESPSPGEPPIVPRIPEIDLISVIVIDLLNYPKILRSYRAKLKFYRRNYKFNITFATLNELIMKALWTILLLIASNVFMTFAWYGHLKLQEMKISSSWPLIFVILFSWGVAFLEYCAQVPANRIGFIENGGPFNLMQLKIIQEVISLTVFTLMVTLMFKGQALQWNHFAAFLCLILAVFFVFLK